MSSLLLATQLFLLILPEGTRWGKELRALEYITSHTITSTEHDIKAYMSNCTVYAKIFVAQAIHENAVTKFAVP